MGLEAFTDQLSSEKSQTGNDLSCLTRYSSSTGLEPRDRDLRPTR